MSYNPYDLVPMIINGQEMTGRPFEFDSSVADSANMTNSFGHPVRPTKLSTCCPDCGDGLDVEVTLGDPPFAPVEVNCQKCHPELPEVIDPFMNPIDSERVADHELDPLLHNPDEQIQEDNTTVADRLGQEEESGHSAQSMLVKDTETIEKASEEETAKTSDDESEIQEKPKEKSEDTSEEVKEKSTPPKKIAKKSTKKKPTKKKVAKKSEPKVEKVEEPNPNIEPAEGMGEEQDIEDEDELEGLEDLLDQLEEDD